MENNQNAALKERKKVFPVSRVLGPWPVVKLKGVV